MPPQMTLSTPYTYNIVSWPRIVYQSPAPLVKDLGGQRASGQVDKYPRTPSTVFQPAPGEFRPQLCSPPENSPCSHCP